VRVEAFPTNPIVRPNLDARMGDIVNGPSLIRVPERVPNPLGRYWLWFLVRNAAPAGSGPTRDGVRHR